MDHGFCLDEQAVCYYEFDIPIRRYCSMKVMPLWWKNNAVELARNVKENRQQQAQIPNIPNGGKGNWNINLK